MIEFSCPTCGKKHAARDANGGRQGFCECGAVMTVPQANDSIQDGAPRVVAHDPKARDRLSWFIAIGGSIVGAGIVAIVVYALFFHNAWERDNTQRLLAIKADADTFVSAKEDEKAKAKYQELFKLVAGQVIKNEFLKDEIEAARNAMLATDKRLAPVLAARAEVERKKQLAQSDSSSPQGSPANSNDLFHDPSRALPYKASEVSSHYTREAAIQALAEQFNHTPAWVEANMGSSNNLQDIHANLVRGALQTGGEQPRVGRVNYSLVEACKSSWRSEGWKRKPRQEKAKALAVMVLLVDNDCPDPLDREATLDYIQRNIDSW